MKELKQTKEHERKCITKMWAEEQAARVSAVKAESEERKVLMREEMKLKMELMREESAVRREALKEKDAVEGNRESPEGSGESAIAIVAPTKRKRVS